MFVDAVTLTLAAGKGGNGIVSWRKEKYIPKGGPAGGDGGKGGSIHLVADHQILSLQEYRNTRIIKAESGGSGGRAQKKGKDGKDLTLKIPPGTIVRNAKTKEILFDFTEDKQQFTICKGGKGGKGNIHFKSPTNQAPNICTNGTFGETVDIELELKLIADVGLIGMPNAGKSTLMNKITFVPVKIAAYPFTTLFPNLSYVQFDDYSRILIADIPGIIEDAHENKGLGISFLKHIERTSVLVFIIDISGLEGRDPTHDFKVLQDELKAYDPKMLERPFVVALNKIDEETAEENIKLFKKAYRFDTSTLFEISAMNSIGLVPLIEAVRKLCQATGKKF